MTKKFTGWQDGDAWLGYLDEYPDYLTQGNSQADLMEHWADIERDLSSVPFQPSAFSL